MLLLFRSYAVTRSMHLCCFSWTNDPSTVKSNVVNILHVQMNVFISTDD